MSLAILSWTTGIWKFSKEKNNKLFDHEEHKIVSTEIYCADHWVDPIEMDSKWTALCKQFILLVFIKIPI